MMEVELAGTCSCRQRHDLQSGLGSGVRGEPERSLTISSRPPAVGLKKTL